MVKKYWLFKTDPEDFSLENLKSAPAQTTNWSGVRNYQARNFLRDEIKKGDEILFYHSSADPPSIVAVCEVVKEGYADHTQFDPEDKHFYPSAVPETPIWYQVDIKLKQELSTAVTLPQLKSNANLRNMRILHRGNRLSIMPVTEEEFDEVLKMSGN
jgi:predicted RNA-binding protein with PUA-like domain